MSRVTDTTSFIRRAEEVHRGRGRYDYSQVIYTKSVEKVTIKCLDCDCVFKQRANSHISGRGCRKCNTERGAILRRSTKEIFASDGEAVHGAGRYDYSEVVYIGSGDPVKIKCMECGLMFEQSRDSHIGLGSGCPDCARERVAAFHRWTKDVFIKRSQEIHGIGKFDYSDVEYKNFSTHVKLICNDCGTTFEQAPNNHIYEAAGCRDCSYRLRGERRRLPEAVFVQRAIEKHCPGRYDYSKVKYENSHTPVTIICRKCNNDFDQAPSSHASTGAGCPICKFSRGETALMNVLRSKGIAFETQKKYPAALGQCRFDFYAHLGGPGLLIEFDGIQHFKPCQYFGGDTVYQNQRRQDLKKTLFALDAGIRLLRIDYTVLDAARLSVCLDRALTSTAQLVLSSSRLYQDLTNSVLDDRPGIWVEYIEQCHSGPQAVERALSAVLEADLIAYVLEVYSP